MRRPRPGCYLKGCKWEKLAHYDGKACSRCGAVMTATQVITYWQGQEALPAAIVYAATGKRVSDQTWLTHERYGWPVVAPRRFRP